MTISYTIAVTSPSPVEGEPAVLNTFNEFYESQEEAEAEVREQFPDATSIVIVPTLEENLDGDDIDA